MKSNVIANRYAKALYQLSSSKEQFKNDLSKAAYLFEETPELRTFLLAPHIKRQDKENVLRKFSDDKSDPQFLNFLFFLLQKGRIKELPAIAKEYHNIAALESDTLEGKMITAVPLDDGIKDKIQKMLEESFQKKVSIKEKVDPDIIGGLILMIGNQMMDASVRHQLAELKENLLDITV